MERERRYPEIKPRMNYGHTDDEGKFKHPNSPTTFLGELFPSHFLFFDIPSPEEGQQIGLTSEGQMLFWEQGSVVARMSDEN